MATLTQNNKPCPSMSHCIMLDALTIENRGAKLSFDVRLSIYTSVKKGPAQYPSMVHDLAQSHLNGTFLMALACCKGTSRFRRPWLVDMRTRAGLKCHVTNKTLIAQRKLLSLDNTAQLNLSLLSCCNLGQVHKAEQLNLSLLSCCNLGQVHEAEQLNLSLLSCYNLGQVHEAEFRRTLKDEDSHIAYTTVSWNNSGYCWSR
jgi:hypothetical protein